MFLIKKLIPCVIRRSILHKSMVWLGLPIFGFSTLSIGIGYFNAVSVLEKQVTNELRDYLTERGKRESQIFQQAQRNHAYLKPLLLEELKKGRKVNPEPAFSALMKPWNDGTYRNFDQSRPIAEFDAKRNSTVFIGRNVKLSESIKQDVLVFYRFNQNYGPAWHTSLTNLWLDSSANISANYWHGIPWALQAPSHLDINQEEYGYIAHKDKNPDRTPRWTGIYFDPAPQQWMVSLVTPVDDDEGNHIASIGHDITLNDLLQRTHQDTMPGTHNLIMSREGRLIADRDRIAEIQKTNGQLKIDQLNDPNLTYIWQNVQQLQEETSITTTPDQSMLVGITHLVGTDWYFTTLYPKKIIHNQAIRNVLPIFFLAFCFVILEILFIYFILLRQVNQPLQALLNATEKLSVGNFDVQLNTNRIDEVGLLARSFMRMSQDLQQSFAKLNLQNESLETQVADRTQALSTALNDLKLAQSQLIQREKMSGLGQMVAGIAHEINNPISFIHGNLKPAVQYIEDLLMHLMLYRQKAPQPIVDDHAQEIDLDFLETDLPKLLESMKVGTDRIRDIVLGLRNFSRLDESELKTANLHEGIDNTLLILNHRFKQALPEIIIQKDYDPELGPIDCYPSQINQVVMNLLSNSIDALESYSSDHLDRAIHHQLIHGSGITPWQPMISITTRCQENSVEIRIHDNGPGIPASIRDQIFNPFFTTKPIGQGTGLGLSISHSIIVERHAGSIRCESDGQSGTTFQIEIPLWQIGEGSRKLTNLKQTLSSLH